MSSGLKLTIIIHHDGRMSIDSTMGLMNMFQLSNQVIITIQTLDRSKEGQNEFYQLLSQKFSQWLSTATDMDMLLLLNSDVFFSRDDIVAIINTGGDIVSAIIDYHNVSQTFESQVPSEFRSGNNMNLRVFNMDLVLFRKTALQRVIPKMEKIALSSGEEVYPFFGQKVVGNIWLSGIRYFCRVASVSNVSIVGYISETLKKSVYTSDNSKLERLMDPPKVWGSKTIVYYCPQDLVYWSPRIHKEKGLGGSETAVVKLAEFWQSQGYSVHVYGNVEEGHFDGVEYLSTRKFSTRDTYNILVLWRAGITVLNKVKAKKLFVDLHDNPNEAVNFILNSHLQKINKIFVRSSVHKDLLDISLHPKVECLENGVDKEMIHIARVPEDEWNKYRIIYASSYDRGLFQMLEHGFPRIKKEIPEAELHVYYGMDLLPKHQISIIKTLLDQPGVFDHGKVNQEYLASERWRSGIHYYVGGFEETDCITVKESVCCGCIPVLGSSKIFKQREYLREFVVAEENGYSVEAQLKAVERIVELYKNEDLFDRLREKVSKLGETDAIPSWNDIGKKWLSFM